mmetsp:Transcript_76744/g.220359  ORF Transcript_76744/g.220359 Transcript_76744/m.220359 type:complete len:129 (+) Transcript_76744:663-1049(+)
MSDFHMAPDEAMKFSDGLGECGTGRKRPHEHHHTYPSRLTFTKPSSVCSRLTNHSLHPGNLKELAELEMVNVHLTDDTAYPIAESLSMSNPKMKKVNFGENGLGGETKTKMGKLFETTHRGFILDAYG